MPKNTCESRLALSTRFLKKFGYLNGDYKSGSIIWTYRDSNNKSSVGIIGCIYGDDSYIRLQYTHTDYDGIKTDMDYQVEVVSTPCYFGGKRYWFICPLLRNGIPCRNRVSILYGSWKYYGCRRCLNLAYRSQQETHTGWFKVFGKVIGNIYEEKEAKLRVKYWHGMPTKRYRRILEKIGNRPSANEVDAAIKIMTRRSRK